MSENLVIRSREAARRAAIERAALPWEGVRGVHIHKTLADVPDDAVRQTLALDGTIACWYDEEGTHVYLPNIVDPRQVRDSVLQSSAAHGSVPALIPDEGERRKFYMEIEKRFSSEEFYARQKEAVDRDTKRADRIFAEKHLNYGKAPVLQRRDMVCDKLIRESARRFLQAAQYVVFSADGRFAEMTKPPADARYDGNPQEDITRFLQIMGGVLERIGSRSDVGFPIDSDLFFVTRLPVLNETKLEIASAFARGFIEDDEPVKVIRTLAFVLHTGRPYSDKVISDIKQKYAESSSQGHAAYFSNLDFLDLGPVPSEAATFYGISSKRRMRLPFKGLLGATGEKASRHRMDISALLDRQKDVPAKGLDTKGIYAEVQEPLLLCNQDANYHEGAGFRIITGIMEERDYGLPFLHICPVAAAPQKTPGGRNDCTVRTVYQYSPLKIMRLLYHGAVTYISPRFAKNYFPFMEKKARAFYTSLAEAADMDPRKAADMLRFLQDDEMIITPDLQNLSISSFTTLEDISRVAKAEANAFLSQLDTVRGIVERGTVRPPVPQGVDLRRTESDSAMSPSYIRGTAVSTQRSSAPYQGLYSDSDREELVSAPLRQAVLDAFTRPAGEGVMFAPLRPHGRMVESPDRLIMESWQRSHQGSSPYWFSESELARYGLQPKGEGVVIFNSRKDMNGESIHVPQRLWNLAETDFERRYPADADAMQTYLAEIESSASKSRDSSAAMALRDELSKDILKALPQDILSPAREAMAFAYAASFSGLPAVLPEGTTKEALCDALSNADARSLLEASSAATRAAQAKLSEESARRQDANIHIGEAWRNLYKDFNSKSFDGRLEPGKANYRHPFDFINVVGVALSGKTRQIPDIYSSVDRKAASKYSTGRK